MSNMKNIIEESFVQYSGATIQSRALTDVRDCLKPSARQIFYCMYTDKFIHNKPPNYKYPFISFSASCFVE